MIFFLTSDPEADRQTAVHERNGERIFFLLQSPPHLFTFSKNPLQKTRRQRAETALLSDNVPRDAPSTAATIIRYLTLFHHQPPPFPIPHLPLTLPSPHNAPPPPSSPLHLLPPPHPDANPHSATAVLPPHNNTNPLHRSRRRAPFQRGFDLELAELKGGYGCGVDVGGVLGGWGGVWVSGVFFWWWWWWWCLCCG